MRTNRLTTPWLIAMVALLAGCASGPKIRSNTDPQANLSSYRTYGFVEPLGTDRTGYSTIVSGQLKSAARRELDARGYTYAQDNPQLLVNFNAKLDDKLRVDSTPTASVAMGRGYYGYRGGFYSAWPAYETSVDQYTEGTLNVDVVDAAQKRLLWEGVAVGRVTEKTRENLGAAIDSTVAEIFKKFPATARAAAN
jgi:starvation-inducible outer membrane lipoprotein